MKRFRNAMVFGHLLGVMTLIACYFTSSILLPSESGITPAFTVVVSFFAFVLGFSVAFFLLPNQPKP